MRIEWSPAARALARRYMDDQDGMRAIGTAVAGLAEDPTPSAAFHRGDYHRLRVGRYRVVYVIDRDLRSRSREIMDAVDHGQSFTLTRDGHRIGELIPLRERRRFVSRQEFIDTSRNAPTIDPEAFRADQDPALDHGVGSALSHRPRSRKVCRSTRPTPAISPG